MSPDLVLRNVMIMSLDLIQKMLRVRGKIIRNKGELPHLHLLHSRGRKGRNEFSLSIGFKVKQF